MSKTPVARGLAARGPSGGRRGLGQFGAEFVVGERRSFAPVASARRVGQCHRGRLLRLRRRFPHDRLPWRLFGVDDESPRRAVPVQSVRSRQPGSLPRSGSPLRRQRDRGRHPQVPPIERRRGGPRCRRHRRRDRAAAGAATGTRRCLRGRPFGLRAHARLAGAAKAKVPVEPWSGTADEATGGMIATVDHQVDALWRRRPPAALWERVEGMPRPLAGLTSRPLAVSGWSLATRGRSRTAARRFAPRRRVRRTGSCGPRERRGIGPGARAR